MSGAYLGKEYRKYTPRSVPLITLSGTGTGSVAFRQPIPDSRLRVKISLLFTPAAGVHPTAGVAGTASIWLFGSDEDETGVSGDFIPHTNLEGTQAAPTSIPAADGLLGYSREFVTSSDYIEGVFTAHDNVALGTWNVKTRFQPDAVTFSEDEWMAIVALCRAPTVSRQIVFP